MVEDFNYGTLLRLDCEKDYTEENTIFGMFSESLLHIQNVVTVKKWHEEHSSVRVLCSPVTTPVLTAIMLFLQPPGSSSLPSRSLGTEKDSTPLYFRPKNSLLNPYPITFLA